MPQLILEYSANIIEKENLTTLFQQCHEFLAKSLPTELASCKSRAIKCENYCIGDNAESNAFVHISLKVMSGRSKDTLHSVGQSMMNILSRYFEKSLQQLKLQISLEISELQTTYFKISST